MPAIHVFPHSTTVSLSAQHEIDPRNNWLVHLAPYGTGIFHFGPVHPPIGNNVFVRKALMTTAHAFRHYLRPHGLQVEVVNEVVYLHGNVPADVVVIMAEQLALLIEGVESVCNETTKVQDETYAIRRHRSAVHAETDQELRYRMEVLLETDRSLRPCGLKVEVRDDKTTVTGTVPTEQHLDWVETLCQEFEGAGRIQLRIKTNPEINQGDCCHRPVDNDSIQTYFHTRLRLLKLARKVRIESHCRHGHLELRGVTPNPEIKGIIEQLARSTCGVKDVTSELMCLTDVQA
ncbi:MAG: BON domain-containing protein [Verrucomicrobiota bacterium]